MMSKKEGRWGKNPKPQTQNRNFNPKTREENGKKREEQQKKEENPTPLSPSENRGALRKGGCARCAVYLFVNQF